MTDFRCSNCLRVNVKDLFPIKVEDPTPFERDIYDSVQDPRDEEAVETRPAFIIGQNIDEVCKSAYRGCYLCRFILQAAWIEWRVTQAETKVHSKHNFIFDSFRPENAKAIGPVTLTSKPPDPSVLDLSRLEDQLQIRKREMDYPPLRLRPWNITISGTDVTSNYRDSEVSPAVNPLDDSVVGLVKEWTTDCLSCHSLCRSAYSESWESDFENLRVIDVRCDDDDSHLKLVPYSQVQKLAETMTFEYLALSYQWGNIESENFMTTALNIEFRMQGFNITSIPRTMQHAVDVTRRLGYRYLWIDALCIVQSHQRKLKIYTTPDLEWHIQIMHLVYARALYTIAACYAEHSDSGFLEDRWFAVYKATEVELPLYHGSSLSQPATNEAQDQNGLGKFTVSTEPRGVYKATFRPSWETAIDYAPIESRGWCFQERALSLRRLCFTPYGLYWECHELLASESRPQGYRSITREHDGTISSRRERKYMLKGDGSSDVWDYSHHNWQRLVADYSERVLGRPGLPVTDRLNALTGVVNDWRLKSGRRDRYLAGIWEANLAIDLAWRAATQACFPESRQREKTPGFPSWSWASMGNCEVCYPWRTHNGIENVAKPWDPPLRLIEANGDPKQGFLLIEGWLAVVPVSLTTEDKNRYGTDRHWNVIQGPEDYILLWGVDTIGIDFKSKHIYCLALASYELYDGGDLHTTIILEPTEHTDVFRRVGWFDTVHKGCLRLGEKRRIKLI